MKENYDILALGYAAKSDSLVYMTQLNSNLNVLLSNKDKEIGLMKENQMVFENIISIKDQEIAIHKKKIKILQTQKFVSYLLTSTALAFSGYIIVRN